MKLTITRSLSEKKMLEKRIEKTIEEMKLLDVYQGRQESVALIHKMPKEAFISQSKETCQSLIDLMARRDKIVSGIMKSNSVTTVRIGATDMTVAEAIDKKKAIEYKKKFLLALKTQLTFCNNEIEKARLRSEELANKMIEQTLTSATKRATKEEIENVSIPIIKANELNIIDPINARDKIKSLELEIEVFESEVDLILSESNAKTEIEL